MYVVNCITVSINATFLLFTLGSSKDFEELLQLTNGKPREVGNYSVTRDSK